MTDEYSCTDHQPDNPKCRWSRRPEFRPQEILNAAVGVFAELGYERATIADVARRAGVSPSLVVHYFHSKPDLFEAVIDGRFICFLAGEEALLASHRGPYRALLHQMVRRFWEHVSAPGSIELALVVKAERASFPDAIRTVFQQISERWRRLIEGVLDAGARQGEFRLSGPHVARVISAMVVGVVESTRCFGSFDPKPSTSDELWAALVELLDGGVLVVRPEFDGEPVPAVLTTSSTIAPEPSGASRQQGELQ
jgi:AcrR family transcriptional regulator